MSYWSAVLGRIAFPAVLAGALIAAGIIGQNAGLWITAVVAIVATLVILGAVYWVRSQSRRDRRDGLTSRPDATWLGDVVASLASSEGSRDYAVVRFPDSLEFWADSSPTGLALRIDRSARVRATSASEGLFALAGHVDLRFGRHELPVRLLGPMWGEYPATPRMTDRFAQKIEAWSMEGGQD